jgi:hypothetical protein
MTLKYTLLYLIGQLFFSAVLMAQDSAKQKLLQIPDKLFSKIDNEIAGINKKMSRQTEKYLLKLEMQEKRILRKLARKNPEKAKAWLDNGFTKLTDLKNNPAAQGAQSAIIYNGRLDSLTALGSFVKLNMPAEAGAAQKQLQAYSSSLESLQQQFNQAERIKALVKEREQHLKTLVQNTPLAKQYKKFQKQFYYYRQQAEEYKSMLKDPSKLEKKAFEVLSKTTAFKQFFANNSRLGSLFSIPGATTPGNTTLAAGLQTQAMVMGQLRSQFNGGPNAAQRLQQNMAVAQNQLSELKNKPGGSGDVEMPDFKPNGQKTKSFWKRWQLGTNLQSTKGSRFFPLTADLGLSAGYKLNNKSIIGIGGSYKLGLGSGWNNIRLSQQGASIRSFIDYKIKGNFWLSGGYENHFRSSLLTPLAGGTLRQESALLGVSKKYNIGKKFKGNMSLLYDFLYKNTRPVAQPVVFRLGYTFK